MVCCPMEVRPQKLIISVNSTVVFFHTATILWDEAVSLTAADVLVYSTIGSTHLGLFYSYFHFPFCSWLSSFIYEDKLLPSLECSLWPKHYFVFIKCIKYFHQEYQVQEKVKIIITNNCFNICFHDLNITLNCPCKLTKSMHLISVIGPPLQLWTV